MKRRRQTWRWGWMIAIVVIVLGAGRLAAYSTTAPLLVQATPLPTTQVPAAPPSPQAPSSLPSPLLVPPPPPASTAPPAPVAGEYRDPAGRFRVGLLQDCVASPIAGSVLVEAKDGNLAYTVVSQSQPAGAPIGLGGLDTLALTQIATRVFQRGEGFQPGQAQPESGGGAVMNWTGTLTIAGKSQPVGGIILVRPSPSQLLLVLVAATQAGAERVPPAVTAIANSLQAL